MQSSLWAALTQVGITCFSISTIRTCRCSVCCWFRPIGLLLIMYWPCIAWGKTAQREGERERGKKTQAVGSNCSTIMITQSNAQELGDLNVNFFISIVQAYTVIRSGRHIGFYYRTKSSASPFLRDSTAFPGPGSVEANQLIPESLSFAFVQAESIQECL